jgi:hypothetical protein
MHRHFVTVLIICLKQVLFFIFFNLQLLGSRDWSQSLFRLPDIIIIIILPIFEYLGKQKGKLKQTLTTTSTTSTRLGLDLVRSS